MEDTMAEAYHDLKKLYLSILEINKEKDNKIKLLEKEVKTLQGQLQEQYKVRQERYDENNK
tara:strand:- start:16702 stop:16884 length:183 start_codon:yes stop_codon:yes gene_type:complete